MANGHITFERLALAAGGLLVAIAMGWQGTTTAQVRENTEELARREVILKQAEVLPQMATDIEVLKQKQRQNEAAHKRIEKGQDKILDKLDDISGRN